MESLKLIKALELNSEAFNFIGKIILASYLEGATDALKLSREEIKLKILTSSKEINLNLQKT